MYLQDVSFGHIHIQPPKAIDEDHYVFGIHYKNEYTKPIVFQSTNAYRIHVEKDQCELHIKHKSDLRFFNELYKHLTNQLYEHHEDWFETKFERTKYDAMFKHYLYPNIEENAVNIKCNIQNDILNDSTPTDLIIPTFELSSILFDQSSFSIALNVTHLKPIEPPPSEVQSTPEVQPAPEVPVPAQIPSEKECEIQAEKDTLSNQFDLHEDKQEKEIDSTDSAEEIQEVQLKKMGDLEEATLQLNDEDYYILFNIIKSNIKENFSHALLNTFQEKKIETKNINIQDIVYDSDEEDSEDEYLQNDDFEKDYNNMVN